MKVGDLVKFRRTGILATILEKTIVPTEKSGDWMCTIYVHGEDKGIRYKNPTKVTVAWLKTQVEQVN